MSSIVRVGIDLGGTKIEGIALDGAGRELARLRVATPREYDATVGAIADVVDRLEEQGGRCEAVGIGIPGTISPLTGLVKNANSTWLIGQPLDVDLADRLGRPVRIMNDANCFALSEATDGAGKGARVVFGVILGTGVGGGLVFERKVWAGPQGIAGEWGHNPLPWPEGGERPGPSCYCGLSGCIETFLSGPGMARDHREATGDATSTRRIVEAAQKGAAAASDTLTRYVNRLGRALATVVNILDPDVIVLGGGMSNLPDLAPRAEAALAPYVFTDRATTRVRRNVHGDASGVRGAAWLWPAPGRAAGSREPVRE